MREIEGTYKANIEFHYGFMRLIDMISNFVRDNNLKEKQTKPNAEYMEFKKLNRTTSASISYEDIIYTLEDNILTFKKLKEKINIVYWKDDEYFEIPYKNVCSKWLDFNHFYTK